MKGTLNGEKFSSSEMNDYSHNELVCYLNAIFQEDSVYCLYPFRVIGNYTTLRKAQLFYRAISFYFMKESNLKMSMMFFFL